MIERGRAMLCPECEDWAVDSADVFCGGCGAFVQGATVAFGRRDGPDGPVPLLRVVRQRGVEVPFGIFAVTAAGERLIARVYAKEEFADGKLIPEAGPGDEHALAVRALIGENGRVSPNVIAAAIVSRVADAAPRTLALAEPLVDCAAARVLAPGWRGIPVELRCTGGPLVITAVRLRVDGEAAGDDEPGDVRAGVRRLLVAGQAAVVTAWISEAEYQSVMRSGRARTGRVDVDVEDGVASRQVSISNRAHLFRAQPADFTVALALRVRGRSGQRARIGAGIGNAGSEPLVVQAVEVAFDGVPLAVAVPLEWREPINPGEDRRAELRPLLAVSPGRGTITLRVTAAALGDGMPIVRTMAHAAEVVAADAAYDGWVCVDFGTSESGAAAVLDDGSTIIVELGRVPVEHRLERQGEEDRAGRYLPTIVAEMADGSWRTGADAGELVHALALEATGQPWPGGIDRPATVVTEFKWQLDDHQADGGARGQRLATAFLRVVRGLIENHPAIAATLGGGGRVCATRPTIFDRGRSERLAQAFVDAGFDDPRITLPFNERTLVAESWSPLPFVLVEGSDAELRDYVRPLDPELQPNPVPDPAARNGASAWIVVCDVGAGSADFSVVELVPGRGCQRVVEREAETDLEFAGRRFRDLIAAVLLDWATARHAAVGDTAIDREALAIELGAHEAAAPQARARFRRAVEAIQFHPGVLADPVLGGRIDASFSAIMRDGVADPDELSTLAEVVRSAFAPGESARRAARRYLPVELGAGAVLDVDTVGEVMATLTVRFVAEYAGRIHALVNRLIDRSGLGADVAARKASGADASGAAAYVRVVPSGRGAAFPLANRMIYAAMVALRDESASFALLSPVASKSITSWGGVQMAFNLEGNPDFPFEVDLGGTPPRLRAIVAKSLVGKTTLPFDTLSRGAALALFKALEMRRPGLSTINVDEGPEPGAPVHTVTLPPAALSSPRGWWLAGFRRRGGIAVGVVEAASGEAALNLLRDREETA